MKPEKEKEISLIAYDVKGNEVYAKITVEEALKVINALSEKIKDTIY